MIPAMICEKAAIPASMMVARPATIIPGSGLPATMIPDLVLQGTKPVDALSLNNNPSDDGRSLTNIPAFAIVAPSVMIAVNVRVTSVFFIFSSPKKVFNILIVSALSLPLLLQGLCHTHATA
jgi:hypothetical protein